MLHVVLFFDSIFKEGKYRLRKNVFNQLGVFTFAEIRTRRVASPRKPTQPAAKQRLGSMKTKLRGRK